MTEVNFTSVNNNILSDFLTDNLIVSLRKTPVWLVFNHPSNISPSSQTKLIFLFPKDYADHSTYTTLNWGAEGIRELSLDVYEIELKLKKLKALVSCDIFFSPY